MNIALIGPPGTGKGTQTETLVRNRHFSAISTGLILRESLQRQTALGLLAKKYMNQGELVPDEVVDAMIEERVRKTAPETQLLFDGFPRTVYQAGFLDELLQGLSLRLELVIYLSVPDAEILERLANRVICEVCHTAYNRRHTPIEACPNPECRGGWLIRRSDDTLDVTRIRLKNFHRAAGPVVDYYQQSGRLVIVDGGIAFEEVRDALSAAIEAFANQAIGGASLEDAQKLHQLGQPAPMALHTVQPGIDLVLLGGPGSGKGTQAELLCRQFNLPHVATGDLFRENLKQETPLGKLAKTYMDRGELVPDDITDAMVEERLSRPDTGTGFILDGFPRTLHQAETLSDIMNQLHRGVSGVLYVKVTDEEIVRRLSGRWICRNCQAPYHKEFKPPTRAGTCDLCDGALYQRDDDNPETVRARLRTFHEQTEPLIEYYASAGILEEVMAEGIVSEVTDRAIAAVRCILQKSSG